MMRFLHSPLYVFDPEFGENAVGRRLLADYAVPPYFTEDLLQYLLRRICMQCL
jgi:hypothetical protein